MRYCCRDNPSALKLQSDLMRFKLGANPSKNEEAYSEIKNK